MMEGNKRIRKWIRVLLVFGIICCVVGCRVKGSFLYVNEEAVSEEEAALLEQDLDRIVRMKVLQQWAKESEVIETAFSYSEMLRQMEEENQRRAERKAEGGIIYGVLEYSPLQYYNVEMGEYERLLKDEIIRETSLEELENWYQMHQENYWQIGEIQATLKIFYEGRLLSEQEVSLSPYTYRSLSEQNEELVAALVNLSAGEEIRWNDSSDREWVLQCTSREDGSYSPFEEVMGAVSEQYASEQLDKKWKERIAVSVIEDRRKKVDRKEY